MSEDIKKSFKNYVDSKTEKSKIITESQKEILKSHVIICEGLNDYDLVQLVMLYNGHSVGNAYIEKFKTYNYINESKAFTTIGVEFLKSDETISKIKKILLDSQ